MLVCVHVYVCVSSQCHAGLHEETGSMLELTRPVGSTSSQINCTWDQPLLQLCQIRAPRQHTHTHTATWTCTQTAVRHTLMTAHCPGNIRAHLCPEVRIAVCACVRLTVCVCGVGQSQGLCGDCWNVVAEQHKIFVRVCVCVRGDIYLWKLCV